jgi:hypothetical protein
MAKKRHRGLRIDAGQWSSLVQLASQLVVLADLIRRSL